jgi:hypothetical protein
LGSGTTIEELFHRDDHQAAVVRLDEGTLEERLEIYEAGGHLLYGGQRTDQKCEHRLMAFTEKNRVLYLIKGCEEQGLYSVDLGGAVTRLLGSVGNVRMRFSENGQYVAQVREDVLSSRVTYSSLSEDGLQPLWEEVIQGSGIPFIAVSADGMYVAYQPIGSNMAVDLVVRSRTGTELLHISHPTPYAHFGVTFLSDVELLEGWHSQDPFLTTSEVTLYRVR